MVNVSHFDVWRSGVREIIADLEDGELSKDYALLSPSWAATSDNE
jgi:hypothetical protein